MYTEEAIIFLPVLCLAYAMKTCWKVLRHPAKE